MSKLFSNKSKLFIMLYVLQVLQVFQIPNYNQKYIMAARMQAVAKHRRPFLLYWELILFSVCYLPNKRLTFLDLIFFSTYS